MPSLSSHAFLAKHQFTRLSQAMILGLSSALLFTGCGGDSPTTRVTPGNGTTTPDVTHKLTVNSPVKLQNALVRILDTATGTEVAKKTIEDGSTISFDIPETYAKGGRLLIAEISGTGSKSFYFDPALGKMAPLDSNMPLRAVFLMLPTESRTIVSPFTEIAYQRMLVRANNFDATKPDLSQIDAEELATALTAASQEVYSTFRVNPLNQVPAINSLTDLNKFILDTKDVIEPPNTPLQYLTIFYGLGHIKLQQIENPADTTPLLTFAKRAGADMRDGSLDGMGLAGDGIQGTVFLENPIISQQIVNDDPTYNNRKDRRELQAALAIRQKTVREDYAARLGGAETEDNKNKLGGAMAELFATLRNPDPIGKNYFANVNFVTGEHSSIRENMPSTPIPRSFGAGNYKLAFGLGNIPLGKDVQVIENANCARENVSDPQAGEENHDTIYRNLDCLSGANADGRQSAYSNVAENLIGTYTTTDNQCKLDIYFNGLIKLSSGGKTYSSSVNRDHNDAVIRLSEGSQDYLLNVASAERNPPELIQIRVTSQNVVSATAGIVNDLKATSFPRVLDRTDLTCTGFKPVFTKPAPN